MTHPLIGLIGKKRSGKDTFAAALTEDLRYTRVAFADPLREAALALDPLVGRVALPGNPSPIADVRLSALISAIGWESAKDYVPEVRRILQRLGTESIRALDEDFWIRVGSTRIDGASGPVVVTDVRYPNEADAIRSRGGFLVRITRPGDPVGEEHISERALDDYRVDYQVPNDGTVEDLRYVAVSLATDITRISQQIAIS